MTIPGPNAKEGEMDPARNFVSEGGATFSRNLEDVTAFINLSAAQELLRLVRDEGDQLLGHLKHAIAVVRKAEDTKASLKEAQSCGERIDKGVSTYVQRRSLVLNWSSDLMVTVIRTYFEDILITVAERNPRLLAKGAPSVSANKVLSAESIIALRSDLTKQWADASLRGGPDKWFRLLSRLLSGKYEAADRRAIRHLWDTRNMIVHGRGIVTPAYLAVHGYSTQKAGEYVKVSTAWLTSWVDAMVHVVEATEGFLSHYKIEQQE